MFYIIRWKQDFTRVLEFVTDENDCAKAYETEKKAEQYIKGHVLESLLEVIEL